MYTRSTWEREQSGGVGQKAEQSASSSANPPASASLSRT